MIDIFSKEKRSEIMTKIKSKNTGIEIFFQENNPEAISHPKLPFSPDFILDDKIIFIDSSFWHGLIPISRFQKMSIYWQNKFFKNIIRDWCAVSFYDVIGNYERIGNTTWDKILKNIN